MDRMNEDEWKKISKLHGYQSCSESDSDFEFSKFQLDASYANWQPPAKKIDPTKHKIITLNDNENSVQSLHDQVPQQIVTTSISMSITEPVANNDATVKNTVPNLHVKPSRKKKKKKATATLQLPNDPIEQKIITPNDNQNSVQSLHDQVSQQIVTASTSMNVLQPVKHHDISVKNTIPNLHANGPSKKKKKKKATMPLSPVQIDPVVDIALNPNEIIEIQNCLNYYDSVDYKRNFPPISGNVVDATTNENVIVEDTACEMKEVTKKRKRKKKKKKASLTSLPLEGDSSQEPNLEVCKEIDTSLINESRSENCDTNGKRAIALTQSELSDPVDVTNKKALVAHEKKSTKEDAVKAFLLSGLFTEELGKNEIRDRMLPLVCSANSYTAYMHQALRNFNFGNGMTSREIQIFKDIINNIKIDTLSPPNTAKNPPLLKSFEDQGQTELSQDVIEDLTRDKKYFYDGYCDKFNSNSWYTFQNSYLNESLSSNRSLQIQIQLSQDITEDLTRDKKHFYGGYCDKFNSNSWYAFQNSYLNEGLSRNKSLQAQTQLCPAIIEDLTAERKHFYNGYCDHLNSNSWYTFQNSYLNKDLSPPIPKIKKTESEKLSENLPLQVNKHFENYYPVDLQTLKFIIALVFLRYLLPWFLTSLIHAIDKSLNMIVLIFLLIYLCTQFVIKC